eukprot:1153009-Rhodomonas_salina.1
MNHESAKGLEYAPHTATGSVEILVSLVPPCHEYSIPTTVTSSPELHVSGVPHARPGFCRICGSRCNSFLVLALVSSSALFT